MRFLDDATDTSRLEVCSFITDVIVHESCVIYIVRQLYSQHTVTSNQIAGKVARLKHLAKSTLLGIAGIAPEGTLWYLLDRGSVIQT